MFIINESVMNGTVTVSIHSIIVQEDIWSSAIEKVKSIEKIGNLKITHCDDEYLEYKVPQSESMFTVWGMMKNEAVTIL